MKMGKRHILTLAWPEESGQCFKRGQGGTACNHLPANYGRRAAKGSMNALSWALRTTQAWTVLRITPTHAVTLMTNVPKGNRVPSRLAMV